MADNDEQQDVSDAPLVVMTVKDAEKDDAETVVLAPPNSDVQTIALEVLEGRWGQTYTTQVRKLRKQKQDVNAIMAEVRNLSS